MLLIIDTMRMIRDIDRGSFWLGMWGKALNLPQIIGGIWFLPRLEATLILIACVASVVIAAQVHKRSPFTRLTSWVHLPWLPLLPYLIHALQSEGVGTPFGIWLAYVTATIAISLILDVRNLWLYYLTDNGQFEAAGR